MTSSSAWKVLQTSTKDIPRLLVKATFDNAGYEVQLTDASRIWGERLNKDSLIQRAIDQDCSIDTSEDNNRRILLDKLKAALLAAEVGLQIRSDLSGDVIYIDVKAPLPKPLPPLKWTLQLQRLPDPVLGALIIDPLLRHANDLKVQIRSLIEEIASKDRVISKITDRLEASGNDLTVVFPGVSKVRTTSSRQKSQRAQLSDYVRGLGDFDEQAWQTSVTHKDLSEELDPGVLNSILEEMPAPNEKPDRWTDRPVWWENLASTNGTFASAPSQNSSAEAPQEDRKAEAKTSALADQSSQESTQDGDFQRQDTPNDEEIVNDLDMVDSTVENYKNANPHDQPDDADESTEDEEDLDVPSSQPSRLRSGSRSIHINGRNAVNDQKDRDANRLGNDSPLPEQNRSSSSGVERTNPDSSGSATSRPRIGAIGGKSKPVVQSSPPKGDAEAEQIAKPKSRLGMIGGSKAKAASTTSSESLPASGQTPGNVGEKRSAEKSTISQSPEPDRTSRIPKKEEEVDHIRETSEERVARRREELKKMDQVKAPTKKKRKF